MIETNKRIAVIGDVMLDQFIYGRSIRLSPEAPVPIVTVGEQSIHLGGAANVAHNLSVLGADVTLVGAVGEDDAGTSIFQECNKLGIGTSELIIAKDFRTTVKTRIIANHQQVVRYDKEDIFRQRITKIDNGDYDAIIISDYDKGFVRQCDMYYLHSLAPLFIDPKPSNINNYIECNTITPNRLELASMLPDCSEKTLIEQLSILQERYSFLAQSHILLTLSEDGILWFKDKDNNCRISCSHDEIYDVTGAGDTVISTYTLCRLAGLNGCQSAEVANKAAGVVVKQLGTSVCSRDEFIDIVSEVINERKTMVT